VGAVTVVAPLNVPSLVAEDASALYAHNQYSLLALFMKDNVIAIDWDDEVLAKTCLTHAGKATAAVDKAARNSHAPSGPRKRTPPRSAAPVV
jgi:NAD(P) transhydrogenase subunit alpha